jgi:hypothetical protein
MNTLIKSILTACILGLGMPGLASAADQQVYGWQLMTQQERTEYRNKMRSMKTAKEREQFRIEHHKMMQERAKERGVTLPDKPGPQGKGMGPHDGMGKGSGMGTGRSK